MMQSKMPIILVRDYFKLHYNKEEGSYYFDNEEMLEPIADFIRHNYNMTENEGDLAFWLIDKYGSLYMDNYPYYMIPYHLVSVWIKDNKPYLDALHDTLALDYNPLYNRDVITDSDGTRTPNLSKAKRGTEEEADTRTSTLAHGHTVGTTGRDVSDVTHGHTINTTHGHVVDTTRNMTVVTEDEHSTETTYGKTTTTDTDSTITEKVAPYDSSTFNNDKETISDIETTESLSGKDTENFAGETEQTTSAAFHVTHSGTDSSVNGGIDNTTENITGNTTHGGSDVTTHGGAVTTTHNTTETETGTERKISEVHSYGKIGQVAYQSLIEKERKVKDIEFLAILLERFAQRFFIPLYELNIEGSF